MGNNLYIVSLDLQIRPFLGSTALINTELDPI